ncbi:MAG: hypothetical protein JO372_01225 [Solirubrobacterales bacterium]|nr:hypothetical protein [Solirubrobacterales bacterium]
MLSPATIRMLANRQVIAIDQDPLGVQGTAVEQHGAGQVWSKRLSGGHQAVALLNRGSVALRITTTARKVGVSRAGLYGLQNLWTNTTKKTSGVINAVVPAHSVVLYRVSRL